MANFGMFLFLFWFVCVSKCSKVELATSFKSEGMSLALLDSLIRGILSSGNQINESGNGHIVIKTCPEVI